MVTWTSLDNSFQGKACVLQATLLEGLLCERESIRIAIVWVAWVELIRVVGAVGNCGRAVLLPKCRPGMVKSFLLCLHISEQHVRHVPAATRAHSA